MHTITPSIIQFDLPEHLACPKPTEERNLLRDEVRLLVTTADGQTDHTIFKHLDRYLQRGDVLVVNTSATIAAALPIELPHGRKGRVHFSTKLNAREWLVEIREIRGNKTVRWKGGQVGMRFRLPASADLGLKQRYYKNDQWLDLWVAEFYANQKPEDYLAAHAWPIQYEKLDRAYPLSYYQTFFSYHPGSAEMPSAGRGFTAELVERLVKKGVVLAPVVLHTGISSLEANEKPYPEYMEISPLSAAIVNAAKSQGRRIIAVGTTAVRALESATDAEGQVTSYKGNTELFIDEDYRIKVVDGLLTGFHEPRASHLNMLQAIAGFAHMERAYRTAIEAAYDWHQFGDLHLILP